MIMFNHDGMSGPIADTVWRMLGYLIDRLCFNRLSEETRFQTTINMAEKILASIDPKAQYRLQASKLPPRGRR